jgi:hypothetical protein
LIASSTRRERPADRVPGGDAQETGCTFTSRSAARDRNPVETRRQLVDAEAQRLVALGATLARVICKDGVDHYGVAMRDREGNQFS